MNGARFRIDCVTGYVGGWVYRIVIVVGSNQYEGVTEYKRHADALRVARRLGLQQEAA